MNNTYFKSTVANPYSTSVVPSIDGFSDTGLDWTVSKRPLYTCEDATGLYRPMISHVSIHRDDLDRSIGCVGNGYSTIQNETIYNGFRDAVRELPVQIIGSGYTNGGARVFIQADFGGDSSSFRINGDEFKNYVTLYSSHDGSSAFELFDSSIRIVCRNTIQVARTRGGQLFKLRVRHTVNSALQFTNVMQAFEQMIDARKGVVRNLERVADVAMTRTEMERFATGFFIVGDELTTRTSNRTAEIVDKAFFGMGNRGQTAYDLLNGITEVLTHGQDNTRKDRDAIWLSSEFGQASAQKGRALDALVQEFYGPSNVRGMFTERGRELIASGKTSIKAPQLVGINN